MRNAQLLLRCYAERDPDGSWFAMCIDLNLYARAASLHLAKQQLREIMLDYVREALTRDSAYADQLILRRAPLGFVLKYYFIRIWCALFARKPSRKTYHQKHRHVPYNDILPVVPA